MAEGTRSPVRSRSASGEMMPVEEGRQEVKVGVRFLGDFLYL